jgi:peptidoglycan/xylan/chitin deacetylase (PgdA/CDA1 family)
MQVAVFHRIGRPEMGNFTNSLEQIEAFDGHITFDGVYDGVWEYRDAVGELARERPLWLFFAGDTLGTDGFITKQKLLTLTDEYGCLFGWHTWSHPDLTKLSDDEVRHELDAPAWVPRTAFAYPYGAFNERVIELVKEAGYKTAYSTTQGESDNEFAIRRVYI